MREKKITTNALKEKIKSMIDKLEDYHATEDSVFGSRGANISDLIREALREGVNRKYLKLVVKTVEDNLEEKFKLISLDPDVRFMNITSKKEYNLTRHFPEEGKAFISQEIANACVKAINKLVKYLKQKKTSTEAPTASKRSRTSLVALGTSKRSRPSLVALGTSKRSRASLVATTEADNARLMPPPTPSPSTRVKRAPKDPDEASVDSKDPVPSTDGSVASRGLEKN